MRAAVCDVEDVVNLQAFGASAFDALVAVAGAGSFS